MLVGDAERHKLDGLIRIAKISWLKWIWGLVDACDGLINP